MANKLANQTTGAETSAPRPGDYPKMLYRGANEVRAVVDAKAEAEAAEEGFTSSNAELVKAHEDGLAKAAAERSGTGVVSSTGGQSGGFTPSVDGATDDPPGIRVRVPNGYRTTANPEGAAQPATIVPIRADNIEVDPKNLENRAQQAETNPAADGTKS